MGMETSGVRVLRVLMFQGLCVEISEVSAADAM